VIREELSEKYSSNREAFLRELKGKYGNLQKTKSWHAHQITERIWLRRTSDTLKTLGVIAKMR
jgi:hypothetical protein